MSPSVDELDAVAKAKWGGLKPKPRLLAKARRSRRTRHAAAVLMPGPLALAANQ